MVPSISEWLQTLSRGYGSIETIWLKVLPNAMVFINWFGMKYTRAWNPLLSGRGDWNNGSENGKWNWLKAVIRIGRICTIRLFDWIPAFAGMTQKESEWHKGGRKDATILNGLTNREFLIKEFVAREKPESVAQILLVQLWRRLKYRVMLHYQKICTQNIRWLFLFAFSLGLRKTCPTETYEQHKQFVITDWFQIPTRYRILLADDDQYVPRVLPKDLIVQTK